MLKKEKIAVIGLGYVGLPLAIEFGRKINTVGYDINSKRIKELKNSIDSTLEVSTDDLRNTDFLSFSDKQNDISDCNIFIATVPTPIDEVKRPNLNPLKSACELIGANLKQNDYVIFESSIDSFFVNRVSFFSE